MIQTETLGKGVAAVIIAGALVAIALSAIACQKADNARDTALSERDAALAREAELRSRFEAVNTESRMAEYYILELDGKLMAGGFIPPSRGYGQWKKEHAK